MWINQSRQSQAFNDDDDDDDDEDDEDDDGVLL